MDRQSRKFNETRTITITQVDMTNYLVMGRDQYGTLLQISLHLNDPITSVPVIGEVWTINRNGSQWFLDKRSDNGSETTGLNTLQPGDRRIDTTGNIYFNGNTVKVNGVDISHLFPIPYSDLNLTGDIVDSDISTAAAIGLSKLSGYPSDGTKFAAGDGTWKTPPGTLTTDYFDLHMTTTTSTANGTWFTPSWNQELADSNNFHTTNGINVVIPYAGYWLFGSQVEFQANPTGLRYGQILVDGYTALADEVKNPVNGDVTSFLMITIIQIGTGGNTIQPRWYQTSGGALNINSLNYWSPRFWGYRFA